MKRVAFFFVLNCCLGADQTFGDGDHYCQTGDNCDHSRIDIESGSAFSLRCDDDYACEESTIVVHSGCSLTQDIDCGKGEYGCLNAKIIIFSSDLSGGYTVDCHSSRMGVCNGLNLTMTDSYVELWCLPDDCANVNVYLFAASTLKLDGDEDGFGSVTIYVFDDESNVIANGMTSFTLVRVTPEPTTTRMPTTTRVPTTTRMPTTTKMPTTTTALPTTTRVTTLKPTTTESRPSTTEMPTTTVQPTTTRAATSPKPTTTIRSTKAPTEVATTSTTEEPVTDTSTANPTEPQTVTTLTTEDSDTSSLLPTENPTEEKSTSEGPTDKPTDTGTKLTTTDTNADGGNGSNSSLDLAVIGGAVGGGVGSLCLVLAAFAYYWHRRDVTRMRSVSWKRAAHAKDSDHMQHVVAMTDTRIGEKAAVFEEEEKAAEMVTPGGGDFNLDESSSLSESFA